MMQSKPDGRSTGAPARRPAWWKALAKADLLHLAIACWLIYKQRLALRMMAIAPGPANLIASVGVILFLTAWVRHAGARKQITLWLLLDGLITTLLYADILYFRQFGDLVSVATIRQIGQLSTVDSAVATLIKPGDLWLFADIPALAALLLLPQAWRNRWFAPARKWGVRALAITGAVLVALVAVADPILGEHYYGHTMVGSRMGLLNYHAFDLGTFAGRSLARLAPQEEAVHTVQSWFDAKRLAETPPGEASPLAGSAKGKNVILLQVESLQSFPLGMTVGGQEVTPNLNRLMGESITFPNFYHQTGQGVTSDADLLANCSILPTRTGAVYTDYGHNDYRCMPTLLRENGYKAVAMQGMPADFWNLSAVYPRVGFERYDSIRSFQEDEVIGLGLSDESFLRQAVDKLKALPEPYYAFLVTLTSHGPFKFEGLPQTLPLGALAGTKAGDYLQAVHYTDQAIGHFVAQLKAEGLLEKAVLAVYGDHQGVWRWDEGLHQLLTIPSTDEVGWVQVEKRVPFMIRLPGGAAAGVRPEAAGQADIAPTIAGLLGLSTESAYLMGRDLLNSPPGIVPFYRGSAVDNAHLYLSPDDASEAGACYDLATHQQTDLQACTGLREQAEQKLQISRMIVERNLIPALTQAQP